MSNIEHEIFVSNDIVDLMSGKTMSAKSRTVRYVIALFDFPIPFLSARTSSYRCILVLVLVQQ